MQKYTSNILFGQGPCRRLEVDSIEYAKALLKKHFGKIKTRTFNTEDELRAYYQGVKDCSGWYNYAELFDINDKLNVLLDETPSPSLADAYIVFKNRIDITEFVTISIGEKPADTPKDDDIFFYCDSIDHLRKLCSFDNGEDFFIADIDKLY